MTNLQDKPIVVGTPVEIDFAVNEIRKELAVLPWVSHPYFIAQRFYRKKDNKAFYYPETYAPSAEGEIRYHRLTPDNDYSGMFFFMVGTSRNQFDASSRNFITYPVSIIFSVNLQLIDADKLKTGLFTQELISQARRILTDTMMNHMFQYKITSETRDLRDVYREFILDDIESYNRAPMQCFRINLDVQIQEEC